MDYYQLIDSPDIREHLLSIGYAFSPTDKAYVIWKCRSISSEDRHRLWEKLMVSCDDPVLDVLPAIIDAERRVGPERDDNDNWNHLTEEDEQLLRLPNEFAFSFPCPFKSGETLLRIGGEGIFKKQLLRFLHSETDENLGMFAICKYRNAFKEWEFGGIPIFDLERRAT